MKRKKEIYITESMQNELRRQLKIELTHFAGAIMFLVAFGWFCSWIFSPAVTGV